MRCTAPTATGTRVDGPTTQTNARKPSMYADHNCHELKSRSSARYHQFHDFHGFINFMNISVKLINSFFPLPQPALLAPGMSNLGGSHVCLRGCGMVLGGQPEYDMYMCLLLCVSISMQRSTGCAPEFYFGSQLG